MSVLSVKAAEKFKSRIEPVNTRIESALGSAASCLGKLKVKLVVDNVSDDLTFKVVDGVKHSVILGIDFVRKWDVETKNQHTLWRVGELHKNNGDWHKFDNVGDETPSIIAECAGILKLELDQRDTLRKLVKEILSSAGSTKGTTSLVQHQISVKPDAEPVRKLFVEFLQNS